mgnify:CR=1 FL=1
MRTILFTCLLTALTGSTIAAAAPRDDILGQYATAAKAASPAFSGFSAKRGETLHISKFTGGKPATPSCTTCHGDSPRSAGRTPSGKSIEPVAVSVSPARYTDPAKVEKGTGLYVANCVFCHGVPGVDKGGNIPKEFIPDRKSTRLNSSHT